MGRGIWKKAALFAAGLSFFTLNYVRDAFVLKTACREAMVVYDTTNMVRYLSYAVPARMRLQEQRLGIKHLGVPNVAAAYHLSKVQNKEAFGSYDPDRDLLMISIAKNVTSSSWRSRLRLHNGAAWTADTIDHELGHYYADKLSESMGKGSWPKSSEGGKTKEKLAASDISDFIISEGIATYFECATAQVNCDMLVGWPKKIDDLRDVDFWYRGGYSLVKPIIDQYKEDGVKYLITHPMNEKDLLNIPQYQFDAMVNLEAQRRLPEMKKEFFKKHPDATFLNNPQVSSMSGPVV